MDIGVCVINTKRETVDYFGTFLNLVYFNKKHEINEIGVTRNSITLKQIFSDFENTILQLEDISSIYMYSDGYADQFCGKELKKFKNKPLKDLLSSIQHKSLPEQKDILLQTFEEWKRSNVQVDDIVMIGINFTQEFDFKSVYLNTLLEKDSKHDSESQKETVKISKPFKASDYNVGEDNIIEERLLVIHRTTKIPRIRFSVNEGFY